MSDLVFADPPAPAGRSNNSAKEFVAALREHPNRWALYPSTMAHGSATSRYKKDYPGVDWVSRKRDDGRYDMYARWIGGAA